jgi:diketogulonate reductase-like aldo/keto reductase
MSTPATLSAHGAEIPVMGFGTSGLGKDAAEPVAIVLRLGYRHIDTARRYGTERGVGDGIRASGVPREDIFLTTKISHENLHPADFARSVETSLGELQVDYVDLLLIHWPNPKMAVADCMGPLAAAKRAGLTRHIGVANFTIAAGGGHKRLPGASGHQPGRVPRPSRPDHDARGAAAPRHGADRPLPTRPRPPHGRCGARLNRP